MIVDLTPRFTTVAERSQARAVYVGVNFAD